MGGPCNSNTNSLGMELHSLDDRLGIIEPLSLPTNTKALRKKIDIPNSTTWNRVRECACHTLDPGFWWSWICDDIKPSDRYMGRAIYDSGPKAYVKHILVIQSMDVHGRLCPCCNNSKSSSSAILVNPPLRDIRNSIDDITNQQSSKISSPEKLYPHSTN